jgi:acetate kinase
MVRRYEGLRPGVARPRLITLQLGNGCSAAATLGGEPVDTSMGFTPLEGLIMGTRSGDIDPSLPLFLAQREGVSIDDVASLLNERSGLLGLSGRSRDMRELLDAAAGDAASAFAIDAFCYRARKYVGAYMAVLGGADAIVFGGGIGEHSPEVRARICAGLEWAGVSVDGTRNESAAGADARIGAEGAAVDVWVMRVDEGSIIAGDVLACLAARTA